MTALDYNPILDVDSYKLSHDLGYRPGTTRVYSYIESRGGPTDILWFGAQAWVRRLVENPITKAHIEEAEGFAADHGLPFNKDGWKHVWSAHGGFFPLEIKSAPEGLLIPPRNALMTIENTDDQTRWLTGHVETAGLSHLFTSSSIATRIFHIKRGLKAIWDLASDDPVSPFAVLDFSRRGCFGYDHNLLGGMAYLAMFQGSDSVPAVRAANHYYDIPMAGFSVPATEHSVMCSYGRSEEEERAAFHHLVDVMVEPGGILSVVSDTWSIFRAVKLWCEPEMVAKVKAKNITLVIRPDSGDMDKVMSAILPPIAAAYNGQVNSKGYLVLANVKVLWGDGINSSTYRAPFLTALRLGIAPDSIMVGSGGGLMSADLDRDTYRWAMKASWMLIDGEPVAIQKDPITDPGKHSKSGRFSLIREAGAFETIPQLDADDGDQADLLGSIYRDGQTYNETNMLQIRERVDAQL